MAESIRAADLRERETPERVAAGRMVQFEGFARLARPLVETDWI